MLVSLGAYVSGGKVNVGARHAAGGNAHRPGPGSTVVDVALPTWLVLATRWTDASVFMWRPGAAIDTSSHLRFLDRAGEPIESVRAAEVFVDHDVYLPNIPRGTQRIEIAGTAPAEGRAVRFFPAARPLTWLLDPFGLRAEHESTSAPQTTPRAFRRKWKSVAGRAEGRPYRDWSARYVGDFAMVRPAEATGPIAFVLADADGSATAVGTARLAAAFAEQTDGEWRLFIPVASVQSFAVPEAVTADGRVRRVETGMTGFAASVNTVLEVIDTDHVVLLRPGILPIRDAVAMLRDCFAGEPDVRFAYTDEERVDGNGRLRQGLFKPAFSPRLLEAADYVGDIAVYRRRDILAAGGLSDAAENPFHDLMLRVTRSLDDGSIRHIPRVSCRSARPAGVAAAAQPAHRAAVAETRERLPSVTIVIPTRDRADLLSVALDTLIERTDYPDFEIVIVDNGSIEPATFALFDRLREERPGSLVVRDDGDFNFSRLVNTGIASSHGEMICLLNNDVEVVEPDWLAVMVTAAAPATVGIVGARLLFPTGRVQHAGVIVGLFGGCAHWFCDSVGEMAGSWDRLHFPQNMSAVTGACLLLKRNCLDAVGALNETDLAIEYNDIDLCLRARRAGFEVVWTPRATLVHHESASRAGAVSPQMHDVRQREREYMQRCWNLADFEDPYYSPNLARNSVTAQLAWPPRDRRPRSSQLPIATRRE